MKNNILILYLLLYICSCNKTDQKLDTRPEVNENRPYWRFIQHFSETEKSLGLKPLKKGDIRIWVESIYIFDYVITIDSINLIPINAAQNIDQPFMYGNAYRKEKKEIPIYDWGLEIVEYWSPYEGNSPFDVKIDSFATKRFYVTELDSTLAKTLREKKMYQQNVQDSIKLERAFHNTADGNTIIVQDYTGEYYFYPCPAINQISGSQEILTLLKYLDQHFKFLYYEYCYKCLWYAPDINARYKSRYPGVK